MFKGMRRLRFYEVLLLVLIAIIIGAWSILEITRSALFCGNACHIMRPYYDDWKKSTHNQVACVECHNPPTTAGQLTPDWGAIKQIAGYMTRPYSERIRADISDAGCLQEGCHSKRLLDGKVFFREDILFDHRPHLGQLRRGKILRCATCHSQIVMGNHVTVDENTCFICHFKDRDKSKATARCRLCHGTTPERTRSMDKNFDHTDYTARGVRCTMCHPAIIRGNGEVSEDRCVGCHKKRMKINLSQPEGLLHRKHVTDHNIRCEDCHDPIKHSTPNESDLAQLDCSSCHENKHKAILSLYRGLGADGIDPMPSPMYVSQVGCNGCHLASEDITGNAPTAGAGSAKDVSAACDECHGDGYRTLVAKWKKQLHKKIVLAELKLKEAEKAIAVSRANAGIIDSARKILKKSRHNFLFIRASVPVHNPDYAVTVLDRTVLDLEKTITLVRQVNDGV
ncbi:MAG TPA: hypothetical protein ENH32_06230 [Proteobacteria bacterium]|nr:hypothetical protein [Pseudomonadota bacterium]